MSQRGEFTSVDQTAVSEVPITVRLVLTAMVSGLVGMVLMLPLLVGVPVLFGLFRTEPIVQFANIGVFFGFEPTLALGVALFVVGGTTILPLMFLVVGAFLPPKRPRYARGVTFATVFWVGFVLAFWPGEGILAVSLFLVFSLVSHWIYGGVMGLMLDYFVEIPQHDV